VPAAKRADNVLSRIPASGVYKYNLIDNFNAGLQALPDIVLLITANDAQRDLRQDRPVSFREKLL